MRKWKQRAIAGMLTLVMSISNVNVPIYAQEIETISAIQESIVTSEVEATTETSEVSSEVATEVEETTEISEVSSETATEVEETTEIGEVETEVEATTEDSEVSSEFEATTENSEESTEENLLDENQEEVATEKVYEDENYRVTFSVASSWVSGYNANIKIENTGNDIIQNWYLSFEYDDEITNIWNAEIFSHEENQYVVKNTGWNQDISAGGSIEFGISGSTAFDGLPDNFSIIGENKEVQEEDYSIEYRVDSDWGSGFTATIEITNNTENTLEDWVLEFDYDREITQIWNGVIEKHEGNHYVIRNAGYNANIAAGQTISFGFIGMNGSTDNVPLNSKLYSYEAKVEINVELDSDNDGAEDYIEDYFGTDKKKEDTDGDGLSDFMELYALVLDPLSVDTDGDGIWDGDEDLDGDGLSNIIEIGIGTSMLEADTDADGLSDYDETRIYGTNPLLKDTDSDGVSDDKEIELGTNPLAYEERFDLSVTANNADTVKTSVEINLSGAQAESLSVEKYENELYFPTNMPGYIGGAYDFNVDGEFDKATIKFEFDEALLTDESFDPVIYYFNEETQLLEELETTVTGNIASAEVTHFSKYILLNRKVFQSAFEWEDVWSTTGYTGVEIILVIDDSGSMEWNDSSYQRLTVAQNLIDKLPEDSKVGIVRFTDYTYKLTTGVTDDVELAKSYLTKSYFKSSGGTKMYNAINSAFSMFESTDDTILKMMVVLSDGATGDTGKHSTTITTANNNNVKIYTVGLGSSSSGYFTSYLRPLANNTAGAFYLASNASELESIYDNINKKIDIETDSDNDGIADYYEENMVMFNGVTMKLDKQNPDTDGDGLLDGEEVAELNYKYNADKTQVIVTGKMLCDPLSIDSDGDGLTDEEELYYYGTSPMRGDTDGDGLNDKLEVDEWYDPFARDTDGDGRLDSQEYQDGSSPFVYDKNWYDHAWDFISGFIAGDFIYDTDSLPVLMGQIASGFIPFVDIRDVLANLAHGDYVFAGLNALGILSIDGDVTQIAGMVGRYISKHTNISEVAMVLEYLNRNYPDVVKVLSQSDEFVSAASRIANDLPKATQKEAESITKAFNNAGLSDYLIKGGSNSLPEIKFETSKLQHEYKHAGDFGIKGNWNKSKAAEYQQAIQNHIDNASDVYLSTYRGQDVYVYYDPETGLGSYIDMDGNYVSGWKLSEKQIEFHTTNGKKIK